MTDCITCLPNSSSGGGGSDNRIYNEKLVGNYDCVNLTYTASSAFEPDTLVVRLDGITLDPEDYIIDPGNQQITLVVNADDINALNCALSPDECLRADYSTSSSSSGGGSASNDSDCISFI